MESDIPFEVGIALKLESRFKKSILLLCARLTSCSLLLPCPHKHTLASNASCIPLSLTSSLSSSSFPLLLLVLCLCSTPSRCNGVYLSLCLWIAWRHSAHVGLGRGSHRCCANSPRSRGWHRGQGQCKNEIKSSWRTHTYGWKGVRIRKVFWLFRLGWIYTCRRAVRAR